MTQETNQTITIDGKEYKINDLSQPVRQAVGIYNAFTQELQKEQLAVVKTQAALQHLGNQISEAVRKEEAEKEVPAEDPVPNDPVDEDEKEEDPTPAFEEPPHGQRRRY